MARVPGSVMARGSSPGAVEMVGDGGPPHPEDEDHQGEAKRYLRHRDADGEQREHHSHHVAVEAREGNQVDVDGVEHELDTEEDADGVPARDHAEEPDREEHRGEDEIALERDRGGHGPSPPDARSTWRRAWRRGRAGPAARRRGGSASTPRPR